MKLPILELYGLLLVGDVVVSALNLLEVVALLRLLGGNAALGLLPGLQRQLLLTVYSHVLVLSARR